MASRERERERGCARDSAELAAAAGGKAVGDAHTHKDVGCYSLGRRGEDEEEGKGWNGSHLVWDLF